MRESLYFLPLVGTIISLGWLETYAERIAPNHVQSMVWSLGWLHVFAMAAALSWAARKSSQIN